MKIPALDLKRQIAPMRQELNAAINEVIDNTSFVLGAGVDKFEQRVVEYSEAKYAIGVSNGTDAITLALIALGIKLGDGVVCPALTYYATAGAVASMGARPVFADIDRDTYNISLESLEKILSRKNKLKIKAIIPVHLYGQCADMDGISKLARNGTVILKFFLHVSKEVQKKRFIERLDRPEKNWKFSMADLAERERWDDYMKAYEQAINSSNTEWAPWHIIPADDKWAMRAAVADIITTRLHNLSLSYPTLTEAQITLLALARKQLENE